MPIVLVTVHQTPQGVVDGLVARSVVGQLELGQGGRVVAPVDGVAQHEPAGRRSRDRSSVSRRLAYHHHGGRGFGDELVASGNLPGRQPARAGHRRFEG